MTSAQNLLLLALQRLEAPDVSRAALALATRRAGLALELALAGPSVWKHAYQYLPPDREGPLRQQLETLLDLLSLAGLAVDDANDRRNLRAGLRADRQAGLLSAEADDAPDASYPLLAELVALRTPQGEPLLPEVIAYFVRRTQQPESADDPGVWRCLELSAGLLEQHEAALQELLDTVADTLAADPADANAAEVERLFQLGLSRHLAGEYRQAAVHFTAALKLAPHDARLYAHRGDAFRLECEYERAIADYHRALGPDAADAAVLVSRAAAYHLSGEHQRAVADCTAALHLRPDHAAAHRTRAAALAELGSVDPALADLGRALTLAPEDDGARYERGLLYVERHDYALAVADFDRVLERNPHHVPALLHRGHARRGRGDVARAVGDYSEVLRHHPDNVPAYVGRALAYRLKGDPDRAIADYTEALRRDADNARAWYGRGVLYRGKGDLERARADLDEAIQRAPDNWGARYHRGKVLLTQDRFDDAFDDLTESLALNPGLVVAYLSRAVVHAQSGRPDEAIADADRAVELSADSAAARLVRGVLYSQAANFATAVADLSEAIRLDEELALAYQERGLAYTLLGKPEQALEDYTRLIALDPGNARAYANRSIAWHRQGDLQRALEDYSRAMQLDPQCVLAGCNPGLTADARLQMTHALADFVDGLRPKGSRDRGSAALEFRVEIRPLAAGPATPAELPKRRVPQPPPASTATVVDIQPVVETVALAVGPPDELATEPIAAAEPADEPVEIGFEEPAEDELAFEEPVITVAPAESNEADTLAEAAAIDELLAEEIESPAAAKFTEPPEPTDDEIRSAAPEPARAPPPPPAPGRPPRPRPTRPIRRPRDDDDESFLERWQKPILSLAGTAAAVVLFWVFAPANLFGSDHLHVHPARGQIFFDDQPLPDANIVLSPAWTEEPNFPRPHAVAKEDGSFTIATYGKDDGAPPGEYKVLVTWFQKSTQQDEGEGTGLQKNLLPARYSRFATSGLTLRIAEGDNRNLALRLTR